MKCYLWRWVINSLEFITLDYLYTFKVLHTFLKLTQMEIFVPVLHSYHTHACIVHTYIHTYIASLHNLLGEVGTKLLSSCLLGTCHPSLFPGLAPVITTIHLSPWRLHNCRLVSAPGSKGFRNCYFIRREIQRKVYRKDEQPPPKSADEEKDARSQPPPLRSRPATGSTGVATLLKRKRWESRSPVPVPAKRDALDSG